MGFPHAVLALAAAAQLAGSCEAHLLRGLLQALTTEAVPSAPAVELPVEEEVMPPLPVVTPAPLPALPPLPVVPAAPAVAEVPEAGAPPSGTTLAQRQKLAEHAIGINMAFYEACSAPPPPRPHACTSLFTHAHARCRGPRRGDCVFGCV